MPSAYEIECQLMTQAAQQCHDTIMQHFRLGQTVGEGANVQDKGINNPLTAADLAVDGYLHDTLLTARPDYGWLSEETVDNPSRLKNQRVWVVDPIDGTKEFIAGIPQFAISIGLVDNGQPVAAVVYNPALQEMFSAHLGGGAQLNGTPIHTSTRTSLQGARCLASRSETKRGEWDSFTSELQLTTMGSIAYKLALVAMGRYDMTFTLTPKNEWDFCAGHLLVTEAGGAISHKEGSPFIYNQAQPKTRSVVATNGPLHEPLLNRLRDVPLGRDRR
ncbi:3'(2'),5'-bisphosphate nucleotidase [Magnetococcus marinus MC-1]|uniref:3'(2'),5'-bisphosphate nucleotidase n=1 Tax=Magnetococcus marinus (strain ATCC BAA-1437 / JCM 17883 / MC-1) TaxID=156889 RepID=A0LCT0_MAGMM|nr:3'(2'),5'-bisphosphate nucleotidase CysQ [Magnetococcus marinus]ABK45773.1 3'(2'),5'-bisphosphate nucleotidase [Magnetococcus marinus MC-1]